MDRLNAEEIGPIWAEHYPKHHHDVKSKMALCMILQDKSRHGIPYGDWSDKLHHVLTHFGISKHEYDEVEKER